MDLHDRTVNRTRALATLIATLLGFAVPARAEATLYRVTVLARTGDYLMVSGGDTLRVASACRCENLPAGSLAVVELDAENRVVELRRAIGGETAGEKLPPAAIVADPRSVRTLRDKEAAAHSVVVTLVVQVPADTPPGDNLYVTTERSGWSASELRMERVDPLHWSIQLRLPEKQPLLYRYSRGSFPTLEAERSGALAPPRKLVASPGLTVRDTILRFADST